jgi:hypothetical protein
VGGLRSRSLPGDPCHIVPTFLRIAVIAVIIIAWFAIVFTGRYPRGIFDFVESRSRIDPLPLPRATCELAGPNGHPLVASRSPATRRTYPPGA